MAANASNKVDYRLLERLSRLVICSGCLQNGKVTPVAQLISERHALTNQCPSCRQKKTGRAGRAKALGTLLSLPQA